MSAVPTLARRQLRLAVLTALQALKAQQVVAEVECPPATPIAPAQLPYLGLRCGVERKVGGVEQQLATFTNTATLELVARVSSTSKEGAQDDIEALCLQVELAVLGLVPLLTQLQKVASVTTTTDINGDGSAYQATAELSIDCELFETFEPAVINPGAYPALQTVGVHVDAGRPFDASGIYAAPPFPGSVTPAPRTSGPDGRDEGTLEINLPQ